MVGSNTSVAAANLSVAGPHPGVAGSGPGVAGPHPGVAGDVSLAACDSGTIVWSGLPGVAPSLFAECG
jgi:hypothetical protein